MPLIKFLIKGGASFLASISASYKVYGAFDIEPPSRTNGYFFAPNPEDSILGELGIDFVGERNVLISDSPGVNISPALADLLYIDPVLTLMRYNGGDHKSRGDLSKYLPPAGVSSFQTVDAVTNADTCVSWYWMEGRGITSIIESVPHFLTGANYPYAHLDDIPRLMGYLHHPFTVGWRKNKETQNLTIDFIYPYLYIPPCLQESYLTRVVSFCERQAGIYGGFIEE